MCTSSPRRSAWRSGEPYCRQAKSSGRDVRPASRPRRARPRRLAHGRGPVAGRHAAPRGRGRTPGSRRHRARRAILRSTRRRPRHPARRHSRARRRHVAAADPGNGGDAARRSASADRPHTYYNPVLAFGLKSFARTAADAGTDGVLVPDLPWEESEPLRAEAEPAGLDVIQFVAPTSTPARVKTIARLARGFIYLVSLTGVTGERRELPKDLDAQIRTLRLLTTKPVCVGFGVSTPDQVAAVAAAADGVAVGSAIVRKIEEYTATPTLIEKVGDFIATLKDPLRAGPSAGSAGAKSGGRSGGRA